MKSETHLYDRVHEMLMELGEFELAFDALKAKRKKMELEFILSNGRTAEEQDTEHSGASA